MSPNELSIGVKASVSQEGGVGVENDNPAAVVNIDPRDSTTYDPQMERSVI
jgi:hypothetical protein